ncbi:unnamed protein product, partial [Mesorhabditis belari]|uniref:Uncharacterized protein n=1 Tax=Mesorhabditis belari TaxID=2138241 RepID=A0AAF3FKD7_9BILA
MRRNSVSLSVIPEQLIETDDEKHQFHFTARKHLEHPSLNHVLSGLWDSSAMTKGFQPGGLQASASSGALLADPSHLQAAPLRKTSSAVDWTVGLPEGINRKASNQQNVSEWASHLFEQPTRKQSFGNLGSLFPHPTQPVNCTQDNHLSVAPLRKSSSAIIQPIHEEHETANQGGLVMSTATTDRQQMVQVQHSTGSPFSQHIVNAASTSSSGHSTPSSVNPLDPVVQPSSKSTGMLGNMFKTGFWGRPVVRSDEENYRYMMALDR